jgi:acyl carrier protein
MMLDRIAKTTLSRIAALVGVILEKNGHAGQLSVDDRLVDAGLTSMDMVNLMLAVEAEFDIMIPPAEITPGNFRSIATIEGMVERVLAASSLL